MAYLRKEKEIVEVDFPLTRVLEAITKTVKTLDWTIEEDNEPAHQLKIKTKQNFMAYASEMTIEAISPKENTTRITVSAETPVTTITGIIDFGRTRQRIDSFLLALIKELKPEATPQQNKET